MAKKKQPEWTIAELKSALETLAELKQAARATGIEAERAAQLARDTYHKSRAWEESVIRMAANIFPEQRGYHLFAMPDGMIAKLDGNMVFFDKPQDLK